MAFVRKHKMDVSFLFGYFISLAAIGSLLLWHPSAASTGQAIPFVDAVFTAVSAVCVTGLVTIPTSQYSQFGQLVIMSLIQFGGLGIISFSTVLIILPGLKFSLSRLSFVKNYYISAIEHDPRKIIRAIIMGTLTVQAVGVVILYRIFLIHNIDQPLFSAVFHTISAFCNAGFSLYDTSLEGFQSIPAVQLTISGLFILGGISFIVIHELVGKLHARKRKQYKLSLHTQVVLYTTAFLLLVGTLSILALEWNSALSGMTLSDKITNSFFQAATPRTAGFNTIPQESMKPTSIILTMGFMLIGGAPGSIAGGIKVSTFAIIFLVIVQGYSNRGHLQVFRKEIHSFTVMNAFIFGTKAIALLFVAVTLLSISEASRMAAGTFTFLQVMFEAVSAFGTVGLSLGITGELSTVGKIVVIGTMFAGRVGLVSIAIPFFTRSHDDLVRLPRGEVLLG